MARMVADGALAAMSRRAHDILSGRGMTSSADGMSLVRRPQSQPTAPTDMYRQMVQTQRSRALSALQGLQSRFQGQFSALRVNPFQAPSRASIQQMAQLAAQRAQQDLSPLGANDRYSSEEILRAAKDPANAGIWTAHQIMQEGVHTDPDGRRYVMVKYVRPGVGSDTRKVYL